MNGGFMDTHITVYHVGADGKLTEVKDKEDIKKVLKEDADNNRMPQLRRTRREEEAI